MDLLLQRVVLVGPATAVLGHGPTDGGLQLGESGAKGTQYFQLVQWCVSK